MEVGQLFVIRHYKYVCTIHVFYMLYDANMRLHIAVSFWAVYARVCTFWSLFDFTISIGSANNIIFGGKNVQIHIADEFCLFFSCDFLINRLPSLCMFCFHSFLPGARVCESWSEHVHVCVRLYVCWFENHEFYSHQRHVKHLILLDTNMLTLLMPNTHCLSKRFSFLFKPPFFLFCFSSFAVHFAHSRALAFDPVPVVNV